MLPNPLVDPVPPQALRRPLLADPQFLRLWVVGACAATARWLEMLAVGIFVFEQTGSPLLVAAMLMLRMLPLSLFGVFGGEIASRLDRKHVLLATFVVLSVLACVLGTLAAFGRLSVWHIAVGAFVAGLAWVLDFPVRRTLLADIAGSGRLGAAMSLDTVASSGTRVIGPLLGGGLYAVAGMDGAFLLTAALYVLAFALLLACNAWQIRLRDGSAGSGNASRLLSRTCVDCLCFRASWQPRWCSTSGASR